MVVAEIVKTCSHAKVAKAAVASLGKEFSGRVGSMAHRRGVETGAFAAQVVLEFDRRAGASQRRDVEQAVRHADMPLLVGLRRILEEALEHPAQ